MPEERALMVLTGEVDDLRAENADLKLRLTELESKMDDVVEFLTERGFANSRNTPPSPNRAT